MSEQPNSKATEANSSQPSEPKSIDVDFKTPPCSYPPKRPISPSESKYASGSVKTNDPSSSKPSYCGLSSSADSEHPFDAWNSIMQLIFCTSTELRKYFINRKHQTNGQFHQVIGSTLQEMIDISQSGRSSASPSEDTLDSPECESELKLKCAPDNNVQSLLSCLLHGVHQESNGYVARQLAIRVESIVTCKQCTTQQKSYSTEWQWCLDLPSEAKKVDENEYILADLMGQSKIAVPTGACLSCAKPQTSTKSIQRSSQLFLLYLKRFTPEGKKVLYCPVLIEEEMEISSKLYALSGAILHQGTSLKTGHYSTLIREGTDQWVLCDDERIGHGYQNDHAKQLLAYFGCVLMYRQKLPPVGRPQANDKATGQLVMYGPEPNPNVDDQFGEWWGKAGVFGLAGSSGPIGPPPQNGETTIPAPPDFKPEPYGYCGLDNLGLTCYLNATLQALYTSTRIRQYLIEHPTFGPFHAILSKLFLRMETESSRNSSWTIPSVSLNPQDFINKFREAKPMFGPYQMHDAQEFLAILIELIHQETNQAKKADPKQVSEVPQTALEAWNYHVRHIDDSHLSRLLMGQLENILSCVACGNASRTWMCVWQLQAQLETEESLSSVCNTVNLSHTFTLKECLKEYTAEETLTGDSAPLCSRCQSRQPATKRQSINRLAHYLIVHLKRFAYDGTKIHSPVSIEERLELAGQTFLLSSAVCHAGTEAVGHYYTLYRERDNQWVWLDDSTITKHMTNKGAHEQLHDYGYLFIYRAIQKDATVVKAGGTAFNSQKKELVSVPESAVQKCTNKDPPVPEGDRINKK